MSVIVINIYSSIKWWQKMAKGSGSKITSSFPALPLSRQVIVDWLLSHIATEGKQSAPFSFFATWMKTGISRNSGWAARVERALGLDLEVLGLAKFQQRMTWGRSWQPLQFTDEDTESQDLRSLPDPQVLTVVSNWCPSLMQVLWKTSKGG